MVKFAGGLQVDWIGYWTDYSKFSCGLSEKRAEWLFRWATDALERKRIDRSELEAVLGRWSFAGQLLTWIKPLLGPIHAWTSVLPRFGTRLIPAMIRLVLHSLRSRIKANRVLPFTTKVEDDG